MHMIHAVYQSAKFPLAVVSELHLLKTDCDMWGFNACSSAKMILDVLLQCNRQMEMIAMFLVLD